MAAHGVSTADKLDIPAAEICLFLSLLQQQLEAGAGLYLLPLSGSLCLPASLAVRHLTLCVYCHHIFLSLSCISYCISFALCALQCAVLVKTAGFVGLGLLDIHVAWSGGEQSCATMSWRKCWFLLIPFFPVTGEEC